MSQKIKDMSDEEIVTQWIKNEQRFSALGPVQRMRHNRIEGRGLRRGVLVESDGLVYVNNDYTS